jgi:hypothetical protein
MIEISGKKKMHCFICKYYKIGFQWKRSHRYEGTVKNTVNSVIPNAEACMYPFHATENASKALNDTGKTASFGSKEEGGKAIKDSYLSAQARYSSFPAQNSTGWNAA